MDTIKLIDKLTFYTSYLHTLAENGEHIFNNDTVKHIRLTREYILEAIKLIKENEKILENVLHFIEF